MEAALPLPNAACAVLERPEITAQRTLPGGGDLLGRANEQGMATSSCSQASCLTSQTCLLFPGGNDMRIEGSAAAADGRVGAGVAAGLSTTAGARLCSPQELRGRSTRC